VPLSTLLPQQPTRRRPDICPKGGAAALWIGF
jgi:hypothetical protein